MKTALLKPENKLHLNVIKNNNNNTKSLDNPINTLHPKFTYTNTKGEIVSPKNHVNL
ncbi:hypothetical protein SAMN06265371_1074 [Lutibacter agarilyticus]|uniref:Uncharacterized protein n=1 Tax=Lutibacter agarilyticus TaxID=1109740 RepID=A0A238XUU7_9FLAO|nr:hypothetical protein [Lutibacter agarilyticus]SNR61779.1 hypothetical protein SAMN06265371_1074 [Lutibacter agarilyticus]